MLIDWSKEKNETLKKERNISFEDVMVKILDNDYIDIIYHPNQEKYPNQLIFIFELFDYIYLVPFVRTNDTIFLKTIIPSREFNKIYNKKYAKK